MSIPQGGDFIYQVLNGGTNVDYYELIIYNPIRSGFEVVMSSSKDYSATLDDCIQELRDILTQFIRLLDTIIAVYLGDKSIANLIKEPIVIPKSIQEIMPSMLQALGSSSDTLVKLSEKPGLQTRDCYSIARSIVELSVNFCYITAEGEDVAEQAIKYVRQKSYRDLDRESKIENSIIKLAYSDLPDVSSIDNLQNDIQEFTSRSGREKGWTSLSIDKRIELVGRSMGDSISNNLHFSRFMVYRHSSEILHGTLFGLLYFLGLTSPRSKSFSKHDFMEHIGQQHMLILFATILAINAVVESFGKAYSFDWANGKSKQLMSILSEIPYLRQQTQK